jgi:hypothetical protein
MSSRRLPSAKKDEFWVLVEWTKKKFEEEEEEEEDDEDD